jgi:hypothetical protein
MDGGSAEVAERGVLTASDKAWSVAVRRAEVIGRLAQKSRIGVEAADAAAAELGVSRRQVHVMLRRNNHMPGRDRLVRVRPPGGRTPSSTCGLALSLELVLSAPHLAQQRCWPKLQNAALMP